MQIEKSSAELDSELDQMMESIEVDGPKVVSFPIKSKATISALGKRPETYRFPEKPVGLPLDSNADTHQVLDELCRRRSTATAELIPYMQIRDEVCSLNLAMNTTGLCPPAFRPSRKLQFFKASEAGKMSLEAKILACDRKMIDLHWLKERGHRDLMDDLEFRDFFILDEFDFRQAEAFVTKRWNNDSRAIKVMSLTPIDQWQLASIVSGEVRERRKKIIAQAATVERRLRDRAQRGSNLQRDDIADFKLLWIADQLCDGGPLLLIGKVHGWLRGAEPLAKTTLSPKLRRMRAWTASKRLAVPVEPSPRP